MAAQYDFIAGLDISSLSSVTQTQLMQMINQIAPLSNIGGVIFQAATGVQGEIEQGTNGSPSVTDNPRFARYIWLNTHHAATAAPTPYYYNDNNNKWVSTSVAATSITNNEIASNAAIDVTKLAFGSPRFVLRTNGAGTAVEYANPTGLFNNNTLPVVSLQSNGVGASAYLKTNSAGVTAWISESAERQAIQDSISALPVAQLDAGSSGNILHTNSSLLPAWGPPSTVFNSSSAIPLNALSGAGALARQLLHFNNNAWTAVTPSLQINSSAEISTLGQITAYSAAFASQTVFHTLNAIPKLVRVVLKCGTANNSFLVGDEVDASAFVIDTGSVFCNAVSVTVRGNDSIIVAVRQVNDFKVIDSSGAYVTTLKTSWIPKVYAWA